MKKALSRRNLWDKTPLWVKSTVGRAFTLLPPAWLLGRNFRENCQFLREAQWWPRERVREYQLCRLRAMLGLAYEKTGFYRRAFDSIGFHPGDLIGPAYGASFVLARTEIVAQEIQAEEDYWVAASEWMESLGVDIISSSLGYIDWYDTTQLDGQTAVITRAVRGKVASA